MIYQSLSNINASVLSVGTTGTLLQDLINTAGSTTNYSVTGLDGIDFNVESGSIRVDFDNNIPTTTTGLLVSGQQSFRKVDLSRMRLCSTSGTVSVSIQIGKTLPDET